MDKRLMLTGEATSLARLALPITLGILLEVVPPTITSMMISKASGDDSKTVLAAGSLSDFFQGILPLNVVLGLGAAISTLCAQAVGASHHEQFWLLTQAGLLACAYWAVPIAILSLASAPLFELFGQDAQIAKIAATFILIGLATLPFSIVFTVARSALQAQDIAVPFVVASLFAAVVSLPLGYVLGNYTPLGYIGVAFSTIVYSVIKAFAVVPIISRNKSYHASWPGWQWRQAHQLVCCYWRVGVGSILMTAFQSAGFMVISVLCGYVPQASLAMAASSISSSFLTFGFLPMMGVGMAGTVRIGLALGQNDPTRASLASATTLLGEVFVAIFSTVLCSALARPYTLSFTSDHDTVELATSLSYYLLPLIPLVALGSAAQSVIQACNAQTLGAALNFVFSVVMSIGASVLCGIVLHGGLKGLWAGQMIGTIAFILASAVWYHKFLDWEHHAHVASHAQSARDQRAGSFDASALTPNVVFLSARKSADAEALTPDVVFMSARKWSSTSSSSSDIQTL